MYKIISKKLFISLFAMSVINGVNAQDEHSGSISSVENIMKDFSVSRDRAVKIIGILNFNQEKISQVIKDTSIDPALRQKQILELVAERKDKITTQLTDAEQLKISRISGESSERFQQARQQAVKQQEERQHSVKAAILKQKNGGNHSGQ